jgi:hypothetical protein
MAALIRKATTQVLASLAPLRETITHAKTQSSQTYNVCGVRLRYAALRNFVNSDFLRGPTPPFQFPRTPTSQMSPNVNNSVGSRPLPKPQTLNAAVLPTFGRPEDRPSFGAFNPMILFRSARKKINAIALSHSAFEHSPFPIPKTATPM